MNTSPTQKKNLNAEGQNPNLDSSLTALKFNSSSLSQNRTISSSYGLQSNELRELFGQRVCPCGSKTFHIFYNSWRKKVQPKPHIEIVCSECGRTTPSLFEPFDPQSEIEVD